MTNGPKNNKPATMRDLLKSTDTSAARHEPLSMEEFERQTQEVSRRAHEAVDRERAEARQKAITGLLHGAAVPARYKAASLDQEAPNQAEAYRTAREYVSAFPAALESGAGLLLWGDVGTGKTHIACAMANALLADMRPVVYCTAMEAILAVRSTFRKGSEDSELDVYERFGMPELLILDEIGVQRGTDDERMVLTSIADTRSRNCLPTIAISNLPPDQIFGLLGERMFDRLIGFGGQIVHMPGRSLRLRAVGGGSA
jgi:DNA replication protein DnaC